MNNKEKFSHLFGGSRREPKGHITEREMNIATSVQKIVEEILIVKHAKEKYGQGVDNLVLAGGGALICVANGKILKEQICKISGFSRQQEMREVR